jgi:TetR/AcrR family transcriptional regulator
MYRPVRILLSVSSPAPRSPDRILNKARDLFSTKGYDATSVREICEAAGITKPTLYHFYGSKEGVFRALVGGALETFERRLAREVDSPGSPIEKLRRVAREYFRYAGKNRELARFILSLVHQPPSAAPAADIPRYYERIVALVSRVVEEGVADGSFAPGPAELRMLVLMGSLSEPLHGYLIVGRPQLTPELAEQLVETVVGGWRR